MSRTSSEYEMSSRVGDESSGIVVDDGGDEVDERQGLLAPSDAPQVIDRSALACLMLQHASK